MEASADGFHAFANVAPVMLLIRNRRGECTFVNEQWIAFTGRPFDEHLGMGWLSSLHPADRESSLTTLRNAVSNGVPYASEYRLKRYDGIYRWVLSRGAPLHLADADERRPAFVGAVIDITERRRHEQAMTALAEGSMALASSLEPEKVAKCLATISVPAFADACVVILEGEGEGGGPIQVLAEHYSDPIRKRRADAIQKRWPADPRWVARISQVLLRGESVLIADYAAWVDQNVKDMRHRAAIHRLRLRSAVLSPLRARGRTFGVVVSMAFDDRVFDDQDQVLCDDLARRGAVSFDNARLYAEARERERELQQATAARDDFFRMVSHELRTPLTVLAGGARLLLGHGEALGPSTLTELGGDLLTHADRLQWNVENLLALAWASASPRALAGPLAVEDVVQAVAWRVQADHPDRQFRVATTGTGPPANALATHVERVLLNLLSNADRFSPPGMPIDIEVAFDSGTHVRIADRGPGIPGADLPEIFDRYYHSPLTRVLPGAGLGLSVCRTLVESMDGTIEARNRFGGGLEVEFSLPEYQPPREAEEETVSAGVRTAFEAR